MIKLLLSRWKIIVPIILISTMALAVFLYKSAYERAVLRLDVFKAEIATVTAVKESENKALRKQAETTVTKIVAIHTKQLDNIKADHEKRNKVNVGTIANLRHELYNNIKDSSFRVPESTSNPVNNPESERECYAAYSTLESACKITTLDFNAIRSWADTVCQTVGCE